MSPASQNVTETENRATRQFATLLLDHRWYGVALERTQEVLLPQKRFNVPLAPAAIAGLINLRGQVLTTVDLRYCLFGQSSPNDSSIVIVRDEESTIGLLVDEISDVCEFTSEQERALPANLSPEQREMLETVYSDNDRLLLVLRVDRILAKVEELTEATVVG